MNNKNSSRKGKKVKEKYILEKPKHFRDYSGLCF